MEAPASTMAAPMMDNKATGPVETFKALLAPKKFVFLVFYRGHWCPFCIAYIKALNKLVKRIEDAGGVVVIATAENADWLAETRKLTGYQGEAIVDQDNILAKYLKDEGKLNVAISDQKNYPHGMAQPAILAMNNSFEVLEKWAIVPGLMNLGGAKDRPELEQVWDNVKAKLDGGKPKHSTYKLISFFGVMKNKFFG